MPLCWVERLVGLAAPPSSSGWLTLSAVLSLPFPLLCYAISRRSSFVRLDVDLVAPGSHGPSADADDATAAGDRQDETDDVAVDANTRNHWRRRRSERRWWT